MRRPFRAYFVSRRNCMEVGIMSWLKTLIEQGAKRLSFAFFIGGMIFLFLSFFEKLPTPANSYDLIMGQHPKILLFIVGALFILTALGLFVVENRKTTTESIRGM